MWEVDYHLIEPWLDEQDEKTVACILSALEVLQREGPSLGRPLVDSIAGSALGNLKELRPASSGKTEVRILFLFDPERKAVMLLAGDKATAKSIRAKWSGWYRRAIPEAQRIYRAHLEEQEAQHEQP